MGAEHNEKPAAGDGGQVTTSAGALSSGHSIHRNASDVNASELLAHLHRGGAFFGYWWVNPGRRSHWWPVDAPTPPPPGAHNVYFGVHPATQRKGDDKRAKIEDIAAISCLFADLDAKSFEGDKAAALGYVDAMDPPPSAVIDSGGGYHCYWLLREPYLLTTPTKRQRAREVQARWVALVGGDPGAKDLARILRVPGTRNLKPEYPDKPLVAVIHADFGRLYELDALEALLPATPPPAPASLPSAERATAWARAALDDELRTLGSMTEGERNDALNRAAFALGQIVGGDFLDRFEVEQALHATAASIGLPDREIVATIQSGIEKGIHNPRGPAERPTRYEGTRPSAEVHPHPLPVEAQRTDAGNADRLVAEHGGELRYCAPWGVWLFWDGRRWARDEHNEAARYAESTARGIYSDAAKAYKRASEATDKNEARRYNAEGAAWARWATSSLSQHRIRAMLEAARRKLPVAPPDLDSDPWILNVANGILDLRTGELHPHDPEAYCTKLAPAAYDPDARLALWDRFLDEATDGDAELATWMRKAVGYSLTGSTAEEVLFFVHGPTATGKSTFLEAIRATLGDYGYKTNFATFLARHTSGPRPDIAHLAGRRFVDSIEVERGKRLAEGLVKQLTGGDTVTARFLYAREFSFKPAFKLWLAANDAPDMDAADEALWRRILRVPFETVIPKARRDPAVKATLSDPDVAGAAILAWAVRGCLDWQRDRLGECPAVTKATADLRAGMDPLRGFLADCCILDASAWTASADLRQAYEAWARENGETMIGGRDWSERLRANGCAPRLGRVGAKRTRGWGGVGLLTDED